VAQARTLGRDDVICSYFTLAGAMGEPTTPFPERVAAVAAAGYSAIGMMARDYTGALASGLSDADLRAIVDDHGICVAEIEFLSGWWTDDERADAAREAEATLLHMADLFEPHHLNVMAGAESTEPRDLEAAAERFGVVCDHAADHGLVVAMEFMAISTIKDVATAGQLLTMADRPNGGLDLDAYHYFRSTSTEDDLRAIGGSRINCIQLDDAVGPGEWSIDETTQRRLVPGEGDFDLVGLMRTLDDMGASTPPSVEVLSVALWEKPLQEQAKSSYAATRALLDAARS
jgi:sugar phosphate isomerase/epimerase